MYNIYSEHQSGAESPSTTFNLHQSRGTDLINQPIQYDTGQFAGRTVRAELREIQQASLGRKYAKVDRRPLDPPPVVQLRLFRIQNAGTEDETEEEILEYEEVEFLGLLCTVDLFPVTGGSPNSSPQSSDGYSSHEHATFLSSPAPLLSSHNYSFTFAAPPREHSVNPPVPAAGQTSNQAASPRGDIIHYVNDRPIRESSKMTHTLVGATFVQPYTVEFHGQKTIIFVFSDLAVKVEVIQAQCYGGVFRVYSTKEFPGLQASTELTKQLARWGVKLNTRESERKRRKKGEARSPSPMYAVTGKRKLSLADAPDDADGSDDA